MGVGDARVGPMVDFDVAAVRRQFPALQRQVAGQPALYFDGPAGSQVPQCVVDAIGDALLNHNANTHGAFVTSREAEALLERAHQAGADLVGASDPAEVAFGANMTTLTLSLSRALAKTWKPGDEVIVTRLDHDANVTPWVLAARDAGAEIRFVRFDPKTTRLDLDDLARQLGPRTRLVAVGAASNATGTINPVRRICDLAHAAGAEVFVDAVHYAPHRAMDVAAWDCDYLACSAYKFFGPHVGLLWGRAARLRQLPAYKLRPSSDELPDRFMTGTQNHEGLAGVVAAIDYLASLGSVAKNASRRAALLSAFERIEAHETALCRKLVRGLAALPAFKLWGIEDEAATDRAPTLAVTHQRLSPRQIAETLGAQGIFVWDGNYYALEVTTALGLEPDGMVRIGLLHYNTASEVERLLKALAALS